MKAEYRISDVQKKIGKFPNAYVVLKLFANALMLLFGASTGKEGTIAQCGAAMGDYAARIFKSRKYSQILLLAGVSAAFGGLFGTPLGGLFFALEFAAVGVLFYDALIPCFISAFVSCQIAQLLGYHSFEYEILLNMQSTPVNIALIITAALVFGFAGRMFALSLKSAKKLYNDRVKNKYLGIFAVGTIMAVLLILIDGGRYSGTGENLIRGIFENGTFYIYDFALKFVFTVLCICVGFTGGEMTPLIAIGAALGAAFSLVTGLPLELCAALGCVSVYGAATNTLLAPIFIGIELFGADTAIYVAISCIIAFAVNGGNSIYASQRHVIRSMYGVLKKN